MLDLYYPLSSCYILIDHSMGKVVFRKYVQNGNYYHGEVDKAIYGFVLKTAKEIIKEKEHEQSVKKF